MPASKRDASIACVRGAGLLLCLLLGLLLVGPSRSASAGELVETLEALREEEDAERRIALIPKLARLGGKRPAIALARLVRKDPEVKVRLAAARGLAEIEAENIREVLLAEARHGGPLQVRDALAHALRKQDLGEALLRIIDWPTTPRLERALCVSALSAFTDAETRDVLQRLLRCKDENIRAASVRSLARRTDGPSKRLRLFLGLLTSERDRRVTLAALDVVSPFVHPVMRSPLERLAQSLDEEIRAAAAHVLENLARSEAEAVKLAKAGKAAAKDDKDDRYAEPDGGESVPGEPGGKTRTPVTERVPRDRLDLVWVLDATGSTISTLGRTKARILMQLESVSTAGQSTRAGIVVFRGGHFARDHRRGVSILPLTPDRGRVAAFLAEVRSHGVDDRGSAVPYALHVALDQMGWRTNARRQVRLEADGGVRKPRAAKATVSMHYQSERTRTFVTFTRRTRKIIPEELGEIAALGGGGELRLR